MKIDINSKKHRFYLDGKRVRGITEYFIKQEVGDSLPYIELKADANIVVSGQLLCGEYKELFCRKCGKGIGYISAKEEKIPRVKCAVCKRLFSKKEVK